MQQESKPNYYGIIPANVRYCKTIPDGAKLLYSEITALSNQKGYCYASNAYFAELYSKSPITISRWFSSLAKEGFIVVEIDAKDNHTRKVYIVHTLNKNVKPPLTKMLSPLSKNVKHNSTLNNTVNNNTVHSSKKNELLDSDFNTLWDKYAHKVNKKAAMSAYKKLTKKQRKEALEGLNNYEAVRKVTGVSKCHLSTYLNKQRWLDEMPIKTAKTKDLSNSTLNDVQIQAKIRVERLKNSPSFKELCQKVYSIANEKIRAEKAKIENEALRFLKVFNVTVEDAVRDFDKLIQSKK